MSYASASSAFSCLWEESDAGTAHVVDCRLCALASLTGCQTCSENTLSQYSTIDALLIGLYNGDATMDTLLREGDFGIGTFNGLDGEMVVLDGAVYQARSDGRVVRMGASEKTPFATVSFFRPDIAFHVGPCPSYQNLKDALRTHMPSENLFYAIKVEGRFPHVKVRSVPRQTPPYAPLAEVVKQQAVFDLEDVDGTLLGYWAPRFAERVNVPGFHLHFLTADRRAGGHVLAVELAQGEGWIDALDTFNMALPGNKAFLEADLTGRHHEALKTVEQGQERN